MEIVFIIACIVITCVVIYKKGNSADNKKRQRENRKPKVLFVAKRDQGNSC